MEVLERKFDLPPSKAETRDLQRKERINAVKPQESGKIKNVFEGLSDIDVKNKTVTPKLSAKKKVTDEIKAGKEGLDPKRGSRDDERWINPPEAVDTTNPTDLPPNITPQFQFKKLPDIPTTLSDMPSHSGEIDMMGKGEGIKNVEGQAWARAWSFLDTPTAPAGFDPTYDFLFKSRLSQGGSLRTNMIATSYATPPGGVYKYNSTGWDSLEHAYGRPFVRDNQLLLLNAWRSVISGSPADKYDIDTASWSKLSGDLPALDPSDHGVYAGCLHNGLMYITTRGKILKETGSGWDVVYEEDPDLGGDFYGIASDGVDVYVTNNQDPVVGSASARLSKLSGGTLTTIKELDGADYLSLSLGYGSNSEKLYWSVYDSNAGKYDYYSSDGSSATKILSGIDGIQMDNLVASGLSYDYLAAGDSIRRLDDSLTSIFTDGFNVGSLGSFDEQICIGGQNSIFHTEWEGTTGLKAVVQKGDAKFGL